MGDFEQPSQSSIHSASRGDPSAIAEVLQAYLPRLHQFVRARLGPQLRSREDSVDIVQSTVRELLAERDFEWRGEVEFRAWLFQAALNKIRAKARFHAAEKRNADLEAVPNGSTLQAFDTLVADQPTPSRVAMAHEEFQRLETAMAQLSEPHREVLTLARIVGLPHALIAKQLGRSEAAVRQLLVRAMAALGELMDGK
jgi:RNA polymerase sigma-70 factor, ECF subfamily